MTNKHRWGAVKPMTCRGSIREWGRVLNGLAVSCSSVLPVATTSLAAKKQNKKNKTMVWSVGKYTNSTKFHHIIMVKRVEVIFYSWVRIGFGPRINNWVQAWGQQLFRIDSAQKTSASHTFIHFLWYELNTSNSHQKISQEHIDSNLPPSGYTA